MAEIGTGVSGGEFITVAPLGLVLPGRVSNQ